MPSVAAVKRDAAASTDVAALRRLSAHPSKSVRIAVADNSAADDETIGRLLGDPVELVRLAAAGNLAAHPAPQRIAARSPDKWVRAILAHTFAGDDDLFLPYDVQLLLVRDEFFETRMRVAELTNYLDLFTALLQDSDPRVRGSCAANPRITRKQMESLVTDRAWAARAGAAALGLRYPDDEQILRLARDRSASVQWAVAYRVDRPRAALELIALEGHESNQFVANLALANEHEIMSQVFIEQTRAKRTRADRVQQFVDPPNGQDVGFESVWR